MSLELQAIDTLQMGRERAICCWRAGELIIDPGPASRLPTVLEALDGLTPRAVLLTHIHLDHAAATGALARMYPELTVYVHELGARPNGRVPCSRRAWRVSYLAIEIYCKKGSRSSRMVTWVSFHACKGHVHLS